MAYDFLGTFNQAQYDRLRTFIESQVSIIKDRINHLSAEQARIGVVTFKYEKGIPVGYVSDNKTYIGKLLAAYEVLGGNPGVDLRVRLSSDPVFLLPGTEDTAPTTMSSGEVVGNKGLSDQDSAELIRQLRTTFDTTIRRRFDYLERKIRRALDYEDQLNAEIQALTKLIYGFTEADFASVGSFTIEQFKAGTFSLNVPHDGSLGNLLTQIQQLIADPSYRAITPDTSPHAELGLDVYAPYSSYDVAVGSGSTTQISRQATMPQRQSGDAPPVKPGQSTT